MRVGVFDSGIGGLTVLSKLIEKYPLNDYIYFGDTINIPYGEKDKYTLYMLSRKIIKFLKEEHQVDLIVIACGTISSNCYKELKQTFDIPIIDIITPTIDYIKKQKFKDIGVLATPKTINSHIFRDNLDIKVYEEACPEFVPMIENGNLDLINTDMHLLNIKSNNIVLGCTHYPIIKDKIKRNIIDMADNILLYENNGTGKVKLFFSYLDDTIIKNINMIMKRKVDIKLKIL